MPASNSNNCRAVLLRSLKLYQDRHGGGLPRRLVIHKTIAFRAEELEGVQDALMSIPEVECIEVGSRSAWRGVWKVFLNGGRVATDIDVLDWARRGVELGAGEILLTSMKADGTKSGFEIELTRAVSDAVSVPVIASGGAGDNDDFAAVFEYGPADAALAASVVHYGEMSVANLKHYLATRGIEVRL